METNFSNLQQLWQSQKATQLDIKALIMSLQQLEKKQKREWLIGIALIPFTILILMLILPWRESNLVLLSLILLAAGMSWVLWLSGQTRIRSINEVESFSNQEFVKKQLQKLRMRYTILKKHILIYGGILALVINLGYLVVLDPLPLSQRILAHLLGTLFMAFVLWLSIRFKRKKYDTDLAPIILELEKLLDKKP